MKTFKKLFYHWLQNYAFIEIVLIALLLMFWRLA